MASCIAFFAGSYTTMLAEDFGGKGQGIYSLRLNTETGIIELCHTYPCLNPSYLTVNRDNNMLYCVNEDVLNESPKIMAFTINDDLSLTAVSEQPLKGDYTCHIAEINQSLVVASYGRGSISQFPITYDTNPKRTIINQCNAHFQHHGSSINSDRQEAPHAHQTYYLKKHALAYVPDLGIDQIKAYDVKGTTLTPAPSHDLRVTAGSGPRHMVASHDESSLYVLNELTCTISVFKWDGIKYQFNGTVNHNIPIYQLPELSGAAIRIHPQLNVVYASYRNCEVINIFQCTDSSLKLINSVATTGKTLRDFNLSPDGKWLIAAYQDSDHLDSYRIKPTGTLEKVQVKNTITSPVCIAFL